MLLSRQPETSVFSAAIKNLDSLHAKHLISQWSGGGMSAHEVQASAYAHYMDTKNMLDGFQEKLIVKSEAQATLHAHIPKSLTALAKLGEWGGNVGNCKRDLLIYLGECQMPQAAEFFVTTRLSRKKRFIPRNVKLPLLFLLPHLLFEHYFHNCPSYFKDCLLGENYEAGQPKAFWDEVERRGDPRLHDHPMTRRPFWKQHAIPIVLHGDGIPTIGIFKAGAQ
eukprot:12424138-Karenia_brevis.AAC.1